MLVLCLLLLLFSTSARAAVGVRLIFGLTDQSETCWDGSVAPGRTRITAIDPWRFEGADALNGNSWRLSTHPIRLFGGQVGPRPVVANGVVVWLDGEEYHRAPDRTIWLDVGGIQKWVVHGRK